MMDRPRTPREQKTVRHNAAVRAKPNRAHRRREQAVMRKVIQKQLGIKNPTMAQAAQVLDAQAKAREQEAAAKKMKLEEKP